MGDKKIARRGRGGQVRRDTSASGALVRPRYSLPQLSAPVKGFSPCLADLCDQARAKAERNFQAAADAKAQGRLRVAVELRRLGLLHQALAYHLARVAGEVGA